MTEEQLKSAVAADSPEIVSHIINVLRLVDAHPVAAAVNDYISLFTGLYSTPSERLGKSVPRVVEEIFSFHSSCSLVVVVLLMCCCSCIRQRLSAERP